MVRIFLCLLAGVFAFVVYNYLFQSGLGPSRFSAVRSQFRMIETAVELYRLNNGEYPASLSLLLEPDPENGGVPYLKEKMALIDPWGQQYQYEPPGPANLGDGPHLWTTNRAGVILSNRLLRLSKPTGSPPRIWTRTSSGRLIGCDR